QKMRKSIFSKICSCCCPADEEPEEKSPILSDTLLYFDREAKRRRAEETNLWSEPHDKTHMERDDDRELYNLIHRRAKTRRGSEGYRRLSFDIHALRQVRRDVKDRWKMVLENLGFRNEAESLLTVTSNTPYNSMKNASEAKKLLETLAEETSIFDDDSDPPDRYIFVLDRLIILDVAQDFLFKSRCYYPKDETNLCEKEPLKSTSVLIKQALEIKALEGEEEEEEECIQVDD
uniref:Melanoregulin n=1 Tax=Latimeria chalumnae TaxID=7897 RepID=H3B7W9_LATCH